MTLQKWHFAALTLLAGSLLALAIWLSVNANVPKIWAPFSVVLVLISWNLPHLGIASLPIILFIAPVFMWSWNPSAFTGKASIPKRSFVLFLVTVALSGWHYFAGWSYGVRYQGQNHTFGVFALSIAQVVGLLLIGKLALKSPSFRTNLAFHWLLFAWLMTYAFPYLGELP